MEITPILRCKKILGKAQFGLVFEIAKARFICCYSHMQMIVFAHFCLNLYTQISGKKSTNTRQFSVAGIVQSTLKSTVKKKLNLNMLASN